MEQKKKNTLPIVSSIFGVITIFMYMSKSDAINGMALIMQLITIICTSDNSHVGMVYCTVDKSVLNGTNLSQYDYINVYGEFKGLTEDLYSYGIYSSGYVDYPQLAVKYIEFTSY